MRFFLRLLPFSDLLAVQAIRWLLLSRLCADLYFFSTTIVLFQQQRGLDFTAMFTLESILSAAIMVANIPTSIWADRFGYRSMLLLGRLCSITGILCILFAHAFWLFAIANMFSGFAIACNSGCEGALIYCSITKPQREQQGNTVFALQRLASTCGLFLGLISGSFIGALSPTFAVAASLVPLLLSFLAAWQIQEQREQKGSLADPSMPTNWNIAEIVKVAIQIIRDTPTLLGLSLFDAVAFALTNAIFWFNQPYFARANIPIILFGPLTAIAMGLQFLVLLRMTTIQRHIGTRIMLILACFLPGIAYVLLTRTNQPHITVILIACIIAFASWREPLVISQIHKNLRDESRATTFSALSLIGSLTSIILKPWIGLLGDRGLTATGLGLGISLLVLCVLIPLVVRGQKHSNVSRETLDKGY